MELGITIPLQKFLKWQAPPYGAAQDLFFCWDLHVIRFHGADTLMAVNASNAFTVILWDMKPEDWNMLGERTEEAIRQGLLCAGYSREAAAAYFKAAGPAGFTKTHGRRPVAALNRMTDFLRFAPVKLDETEQFQKAHCRFINSNVLKTAGFDRPGTPEIYLAGDMERIGAVAADMERCPCRRKCPRKGRCNECLAFHREQKPGVVPACRRG